MIKIASKDDKQTIYEMWKSNFSFDDGGFTDFFFDCLYDDDDLKHYINTLDETIISSASIYHHAYMIHNQILRVSMILGVNTLEAYRHQGHMQELMKAIIDDLSHQELITMIQAYNPKIYEQFGFKTIYHQNRYVFDKKDFVGFIFGKIKDITDTEDLLKAYGSFVSHFQGYHVRFLKDFSLLLKKLEYEDSKIIGYYEDEIKGYCIYHIYDDHIYVEEMIYEDLKTFISLLDYLFTIRDIVEVYLSKSEEIDKYIKVKTKEIKPYTMARINDIDLFNRLYHSDIKDVTEAFKLSDKALYMREEY